MRVAALVVLFATLAVCVIGRAGADSTASLRSRIRDEVRRVEQAKTTVRFFESHLELFSSPDRRVRRKAFRDHSAARRTVTLGRLRLSRWRAQLDRLTMTPQEAIRLVFGRYADEALRVVACETGGTFSVYASNHGVYLGLFQFGPYARATFGFDWTALGQARAAWRYFQASGYRWTAWECKP